MCTKRQTRVLVVCGLIKSSQTVNVDFDHVFVKTEKADATYSYKQAYGYFPGVVSIDGIIAYIENRKSKEYTEKLCLLI